MAQPKICGTYILSPCGNMARYAACTSTSTAIGSRVTTGEYILGTILTKTEKMHAFFMVRRHHFCHVGRFAVCKKPFWQGVWRVFPPPPRGGSPAFSKKKINGPRRKSTSHSPFATASGRANLAGEYLVRR